MHSIISAEEKECLITLVMGSADGTLPAPMVMFSYERLTGEIVKQFPLGWGIGKSNSGWMTGESFYEYIVNVFHPWLVANNVEFPVLLFIDGHSSHHTMALSEFCREKQIEAVILFPNATHILQPLDVALFRPLKLAWKNSVLKWRMSNEGKRLRSAEFAPLLQETSNVDLKQILKSGFRATGLYPFDANAIHMEKIFAGKMVNHLLPGIHDSNDELLTTEECVKMRGVIEKHISSDILQKFESNVRIEFCNGPIPFQQLFHVRLKLKKMESSCRAEENQNTPAVSKTLSCIF